VQIVLHLPKMLYHLAVLEVAETGMLGPTAAKTSEMLTPVSTISLC
jgi:hypothetical protein